MGRINLETQSEPSSPDVGHVRIYADSADDLLKSKDSEGTVTAYGDTKKVKMSANDIAEGFLEDKIIAGTNISVSTLNEGANERIEIVANIESVDYKSVQITNKVGNPAHLDTLDEAINHIWSSGIVDGCEITDNLNGTISIAAGVAMLRPASDSHADIYSIEVEAQGPLALVDNATNYISLDYNEGNPQFIVSASEASFNCLDICIAYLVHRDDTKLYIINASEQTVDYGRKTRLLFRDFSRFIHAEGGTVVGEVGARSLRVTAGAFYYMVTKVAHPAFDTDIAGLANENVFEYYYRDGAGGWSKALNSKQIDNANYDNGSGVLAPMSSNKYRIDDICLLNNNPSSLAVIYGQVEYNSIAEAEVAPIPSERPTVVVGVGALVGRSVVKTGGANLESVLSAFTASFTSSSPTTHNNLAGLDGGELGYYGHLNNSAQTISGDKSFANNVIIKGQGYSEQNTLVDAATIVTDCNLGNTHVVTLEGNRILGLPANLKAGASYTWTIKQDAVGNRLLTFNSAFKFEGGIIPSLSTSVNAVDILTGVSDGVNVYVALKKDFK